MDAYGQSPNDYPDDYGDPEPSPCRGGALTWPCVKAAGHAGPCDPGQRPTVRGCDHAIPRLLTLDDAAYAACSLLLTLTEEDYLPTSAELAAELERRRTTS